MTYNEVIKNLSDNILLHFDEVYHSADTIVNDKGIKMPAIALNDEYLTLAPTDQREIIYIRDNGDDQVLEELKIGSCIKSYRMQSPVRIVYFKDHAKNPDKILSDLVQSVLINGTKLKAIISNKWKLLKEESSGDYNFGATTAYFAIDLYVLWHLVPDNCEEDFCSTLENPLKKCPVAV